MGNIMPSKNVVEFVNSLVIHNDSSGPGIQCSKFHPEKTDIPYQHLAKNVKIDSKRRFAVDVSPMLRTDLPLLLHYDNHGLQPRI